MSHSLTATRSWQCPQFDLWLTKFRSFRGIDNVAHHCQLTAPTELVMRAFQLSKYSISIHCSDDWLRDFCQILPRFDKSFAHDLIIFFVFHPTCKSLDRSAHTL